MSITNEEEEKIDFDEAIKAAELLLLGGIGTAEKEVVQEGASKTELTNQQEQIKKDIAWLKKQNQSDENRLGDVRNRAKGRHILHYGY